MKINRLKVNVNRLALAINPVRWLLFIASLLLSSSLLSACSEPQNDGVLTIKIAPSDLTVDIPARGELEASQSTNVTVPPGLRGPQSLAWIIDNFSEVKAGDVVAKMDASRESLKLEQQQLVYDRLGFDSKIQNEADMTAKDALKRDKAVTSKEKGLANRFFSEDERVYTKIDIIDQMRNKNYLEAKMHYLDWSLAQHDQQAQAEQDLISLKQQSHLAKMDRYSNNLRQMNIVAPHDGLFVMATNWDGSLPTVGDMMWAGSTIGVLPNTAKMQAKMYVLEAEALGLAVGKKVTLHLDAEPEREIQGTLVKVDTLAKPKEKNSPVNYFQVTVAIDKTDPQAMLPGKQVSANIHVLDLKKVITVPNQALFQKSGRTWVYLKTPKGFMQQTVVTGHRSLNRTVIKSGLDKDDIIALAVPPKREQQ